MILDLAPGELVGLSPDEKSGPQTYRIDAPNASMTLVPAAGGDMMLAPGEYGVTLEASGPIAAPVLICTDPAGATSTFPLESDAPSQWSSAFTLQHVATNIALRFAGGEGRVSPHRIRLDDRTVPDPPPTFRVALIVAARTVFRRLPTSVRKFALRRRSVLERFLPKPQMQPDGAGRIVLGGADVSDELRARRIDFENRLSVARDGRAPEFVHDGGEFRGTPAAKIVAFYLPQYHTIPENDAWWGRGFTEWTNVAKAAPQFVGHYQPRLPSELGFYDLKNTSVLAQQAALAKAYGISAFCFHYYWFSGKRLLEAPLDAWLADKSIDLPFMLCWANENWTRAWDGHADKVLLAQSHSKSDHIAVFDDMARYLDDARALRIAGAPVLVVYRPAQIPDVRGMVDLWRERAQARGYPGIYLIAANGFFYEEWRRDGFDALCEFPPHGIIGPRVERSLSWLNAHHAGRVFDYKMLAAAQAHRLNEAHLDASSTVFPGVMPGWDNEARRPGAGSIYHGGGPDDYRAWLEGALRFAVRELPVDRRLVFVNAWNEWAEGAHLEPDRRYGRAFLAATARALEGTRVQPG
jgi:hypothetical protein